jgi:hypothetical protein
MIRKTFTKRIRTNRRGESRQAAPGGARRFGRCAAAICILVASLTLAAPASAQTAPVSAEIAGSSPAVRSGAPVTIVWKLRSASSGLVEGKLDLRVYDGMQLLARLVTDEIVLTGGEQRLRTVLPPIDADNPLSGAEIRLALIRDKDTIDLGTPNLRLPKAGERAFVVAMSDPWQSTPAPERQFFLQQLRFETYNSEPTDLTISTSLAHVRPDELSADPLGYCGFDIAILADEGFSELKPAQLRALAAWVAAGGSLCLVPGRQVLRNEHLAFLNDLAAPAGHTPMQLDSAGRLMVLDRAVGAQADRTESVARPALPAEGMKLLRTGLGRTALYLGELRDFPAMPESAQRQLFAFLWKMRKTQAARFVSEGKLDFAAEARAAEVDAENTDSLRQMRPTGLRLSPVPLWTGDQLLGRLMPRDLRVVPLGTIVLLLLVYVAVIGPGDYLLLGALKCRRYTWILFPAITIAFAMGTVGLSNWYMRFADNRRGVTILDVDDHGTVVRRNRFEVLFRGTPEEVTTDVSHALHTAMNHQRFSIASWFSYQSATNRGTENLLDLVAIPTYTGTVPRQFTVTQHIPQWTPQLNRQFAIADGEGLPGFDWKSLARLPISAVKFLPSPEIRQTISREVDKAAGTSGSAYILRGAKIHHITGKPGLLQSDDFPRSGSNGRRASANPKTEIANRQPTSFLQDICSAAAQGGLYSIVSQISPTGGKDFEDLSLLDPSDPNQWLLVVIVERQDELVVYRKLYAGEP